MSWRIQKLGSQSLNQMRRVAVCLAALTLMLAGCADERIDVPSDASILNVHKTPTCGCCGEWVEHMRQSGFEVTVFEAADLSPVKQRVGLPYGLGSCHTAEIDGYFVEGHVPAADVRRLLSERPDARGLTVPGMPLGSPGMEVPGGRREAYDVLLVRADGTTEVYASHGR
jgi:hypothetical protein